MLFFSFRGQLEETDNTYANHEVKAHAQ